MTACVFPNGWRRLTSTLARFRKRFSNTKAFSLVQLLVNEQIGKLDDLLSFLIDKAGLPYLPLSIYDVDRDVACLLPLDVCMQFCIVPFDLISRSALIATTNPFDQGARQ